MQGENSLLLPNPSQEKLLRELPHAIELLEEALTLRANAGGKIKDKIRESLEILREVE